jgi:hypothetical protein
MLRNCIGCGQVDDHPRHVIALPDGSDAPWHHDCHARATGDPVSEAIAETGLKGDELREHIINNDPGAQAAAARNEGEA